MFRTLMINEARASTLYEAARTCPRRIHYRRRTARAESLMYCISSPSAQCCSHTEHAGSGSEPCIRTITHDAASVDCLRVSCRSRKGGGGGASIPSTPVADQDAKVVPQPAGCAPWRQYSLIILRAVTVEPRAVLCRGSAGLVRV